MEVFMNIDDILSSWKSDVEIDQTDLSNESLKIPKLHHKYYKIYVHESLLLRKYESDLKKLRLEKYEFYTQGPNEETNKKGWELPAKGLILKTDIPMYMDGDPDIINLSLKIGLQQEKIDLLESIIKQINNRGFLIKSSIEFIRFTNGG
jgi:thymidylate synthase